MSRGTSGRGINSERKTATKWVGHLEGLDSPRHQRVWLLSSWGFSLQTLSQTSKSTAPTFPVVPLNLRERRKYLFPQCEASRLDKLNIIYSSFKIF